MPNNPPLIKRHTLSFTTSGTTLLHPENEILELIEKLKDFGEIVKFSTGHKLPSRHLGEDICYILVSGYLSFRKYDNATIVAYIYPPMITNLGGLFVNSNAGFVRAESPVLVRRITRGNLFYCLENHPSLWRNVTLIMAYGFQRLLIRDTQINQKNAYYIVRNLLMDLNDQPEKIRNTVSAARYILDRAPLSRSTVMHILSELQRGKYVVMAKGGYLVAINKLPEQF